MPALRKGLRAGIAVASGALILAACGSSNGSSNGGGGGGGNGNGITTVAGAYGQLPPQKGTPKMGGTLSIAESPGAGPNWIFPVTPAANSSVYTAYQFQQLMWRPMWFGPKGDQPTIDFSQSLAKAPVFTNQNKTVTITMNPNWKWNDGKPVTSADAAFDIWLTKAAVKLSPANFGNYTPGLYPDFITKISTPSPTKLVLTLNKTYNQNFDFLNQLGLISPLPAHAWAKTSPTGSVMSQSQWSQLSNAEAIYNFLAKQSKDLSTYASNPLWQVVDGAYKIKSFDPSNDGNTLVANSNYSGPVKPHITTINEVAFTSTSAEFNQLRSGSLDVGYVDFSDLKQVPTLKSEGYNVWGYPDFGWSYVDYNFKDTTGHFNDIINQLYIRQALAHLQDEQAVIQSPGAFDGAAGQAYGPVPAIPKSPFAPSNALKNPYPFSISAAKSLLQSHGWKVNPGGITTCQKPGSGSNECGAGIPAGTPLSWNLFYSNQPAVIQAQDQAWASNASKVGIKMSLVSKTFNYIISNYSDPSSPKNDNLWAMEDFGGFTNSLYPTTNEVFNTTGSFNEGGFSNAQVDKAIQNSVSSLSNSAVKTEAGLITTLQPGLFQPNADLIMAFKKDLSGPAASFEVTSQYALSPEYWYFTK
jgi:peptide/nickel transport system substrate-binding protein